MMNPKTSLCTALLALSHASVSVEAFAAPATPPAPLALAAPPSRTSSRRRTRSLQPLQFKNYEALPLDVDTGVTDTHAITADRSDVCEATLALQSYEQSQQQFMATDGSQGLGGGRSAHRHVRSLAPAARAALRDAVRTLTRAAHAQRAADPARGRIQLGFCAAGAPAALAGLRSWVAALGLPRGLLHGMDVDGVPVDVAGLGAVYVKYSTGTPAGVGAAARRRGRGGDALWRPGDAKLDGYDGDFRGIYYAVELRDGTFRQFGVLPTDLFAEEEGL